MTSEELKQKLDQANEKVEKRINTISKLCKVLDINVTELLDEYHKINENVSYISHNLSKEIVTKFVSYKPDRDENGNWNNDNYEFNSKVSQLIDNIIKLSDVEKVAKGWQVKYDREVNEENVPKIEVIWNFLQNWKKEALDFYHKNALLYARLNSEYESKWNDFKNSIEYEDLANQYKERKYTDWKAELYIEREWKEEYYENIANLTKELSNRNGNLDEERLNKILDNEVKDKYKRLIAEITHITGEITDANGLSIGGKGDINGIVIGKNGAAKVNTFSAEGPVQRFHFRTKVIRVK